MNIYEFLKSIILEINDIDEADLTPSLKVDELALDSLDYVEIQVSVKKKYGVQINPEVFSSGKVQTVGDLCMYIELNQGKAMEGAVA